MLLVKINADYLHALPRLQPLNLSAGLPFLPQGLVHIGHQALSKAHLYNEGAPSLLRVEGCLLLFASLYIPGLWEVIFKGYKIEFKTLLPHLFNSFKSTINCAKTIRFAKGSETPLVPGICCTSTTTRQIIIQSYFIERTKWHIENIINISKHNKTSVKGSYKNILLYRVQYEYQNKKKTVKASYWGIT